MERVTIYIDGFNFYYALKRSKLSNPVWKQYYWIDFVKLFSQFLGKEQVLEKVVYFTATPLSSQKSSRQGTLFNANKLINGSRFEVVRGKYYDKQIICPACKYSFSKPEEKRTDVNISVRMMGDCSLDNTDVLVLVTSDSDLVPPVEFIQQHYPNKTVKVYFPPNSFCNDLNYNTIQNKKKVVRLANNILKFANSVMADSVTKDGKTYSIPEKWKCQP
jgi:uncharacterized LabA/DUF88 family protein